MPAVREHRVAALCNWLDTIPPHPPFHTRPEFGFFADLTDAELDEASGEMTRRARAACAEADRLAVALNDRSPSQPQMPTDDDPAQIFEDHAQWVREQQRGAGNAKPD